MFSDDARRATGDSPYSTPNTLIVIIDDTRWCQQSILSPWLWTLYTSHDAISVLKIRTLEWDIVNKLNSKLQLLNICVKLVNIHWDAKYDLTPININIIILMFPCLWHLEMTLLFDCTNQPLSLSIYCQITIALQCMPLRFVKR